MSQASRSAADAARTPLNGDEGAAGLVGHTWLMVDSTCTRVRSAQAADYSGYKHHKNRKVQIITDDRRRIVAVSAGYSGAVHDKTIWNKEFDGIEAMLDRPVQADKAYAGGKGENVVIFRPTKRNEVAYRANIEECRRFNRELSKRRVTNRARLRRPQDVQNHSRHFFCYTRINLAWSSTGGRLHRPNGEHRPIQRPHRNAQSPCDRVER